MPANNDPIYSRSPNVDYTGPMTVANTTFDMASGSGIHLAWTADATNGGFLQAISFKAGGAVGTTAATVARIFMNNGGVTTTATNNSLIKELSLPATTTSATAATADYEVPINRPFDATFRIYITLHTAPGGSMAWLATAFGGNY